MPEFSSYAEEKRLQYEYTEMMSWRQPYRVDMPNSIRDWMNGPGWSPEDYTTIFASEYTNLDEFSVSGEIDWK